MEAKNKILTACIMPVVFGNMNLCQDWNMGSLTYHVVVLLFELA
jgi:hypothetical protein